MLLVITVFATGCVGSRWHIQQTRIAWGEQDEHSSDITVMLDRKTGRTWQLRTSPTNMVWVPIIRLPEQTCK